MLLVLLFILVLLLYGCAQNTHVLHAETGVYTPGIYRASARGNNGNITVEAEFSADRILRIEVIDHMETAVLSDYAVSMIPASMVNGQTLAVDTITGVTKTSDAILEAAALCVEQAGGNVAAMQRIKREHDYQRGETIDLNADVAVVGAGISGLCSAIAALEQGASVILIEKLAITGGSATASLAKFMICETKKNEQYHLFGNTLSSEEALDKWHEAMQITTPDGFPDYDRVNRMLTESMKALFWLRGEGISFEDNGPSPELGLGYAQADVPELNNSKSAGRVFRLLEARFREKGGILLTQTAGTTLLEKNGGVVGVSASGVSRDYQIHAKNVILACGGYGANEEMLAENMPALVSAGYVYQGVVGDMGDGIEMAERAGAALYPDPWANFSYITPHIDLLEAHSGFLLFLEFNGLDDPESSYDRLLVDREGRRFMNEAAFYTDQNNVMMTLGRGPYYALYEGMEEEVCAILDAGLSTGRAFRADTIEELAQRAGMDPQVLCETVSAYDHTARTGEDPEFGKDPARLHPIAEQGPYYLIEFVCCISSTYGGVVTDDYFRALSADGETIRGLYAVGQMANRPYYAYNYVRASDLTIGAVMGLVAGTHAATGSYEYIESPEDQKP